MPDTRPYLSIIVPVLNEASNLHDFKTHLLSWQKEGVEIIGVDGGSQDNSFEILQNVCDVALQVGSGRAKQMNAGAQAACGEVFLFLHADTYLPSDAVRQIRTSLIKNQWGRFDVALKSDNWLLSCVAHMINLRSKITRVCTGDQALFFKHEFFKQLEGFANIPLMEDVKISKKARKMGNFAAISSKVTTSARRWEKHGVIKTITLMWWLRWLYFIGVSPQKLHKKYYG